MENSDSDDSQLSVFENHTRREKRKQEAEEEMGETQAVLEACDMETLTQAKPAKIPKQTQIQEILDQTAETNTNGLGTFVNWLAIIWEDDKTLKNLLKILAAAAGLAMKKRNFSFKKKIYGYQMAVKEMLKIMYKKEISMTCSFIRFKTLCREEKYYTIFTHETLTADETDLLVDAWESTTEEISSSLPRTETIGTLSTTATTAAAPADVQESTTSKTISQDSGEDLFTRANSPCDTGTISQHISKRVEDSWISFTSPGERGCNIIKLDVIPFKDAVTLDKQNWWRVATMRSQFLTSSPVDQIQMKVNELEKAAQASLKKLELKKDVKELGSKNSFKSFQQRH